MNAVRARRILGAGGVLSLISSGFTPWPISLILFGLGVLIVAVLVVRRPSESDLARQASEACDDPGLMTVWEVAEVADMPRKAVVLALDRDGISRADQRGWRAMLPIPITQIRYRCADVDRWLSTRQEDSAT
jgi:hypothetical protein